MRSPGSDLVALDTVVLDGEHVAWRELRDRRHDEASPPMIQLLAWE